MRCYACEVVRFEVGTDSLIVVLEQVACKPGCSPEFTTCEEQENHDECYNSLVVHGQGVRRFCVAK